MIFSTRLKLLLVWQQYESEYDWTNLFFCLFVFVFSLLIKQLQFFVILILGI